MMQQQSPSPLIAMFARKHPSNGETVDLGYDRLLLLVAIALMAIGLTIVTSASIPVAERLHGNPFHFAIRHSIYLLLALIAGSVCVQRSSSLRTNG